MQQEYSAAVYMALYAGLHRLDNIYAVGYQ